MKASEKLFAFIKWVKIFWTKEEYVIKTKIIFFRRRKIFANGET